VHLFSCLSLLPAWVVPPPSLLASCRELSNHYTSCTSVTVLVASGILSVGHLGDSRAYLVRLAQRSPPSF
jgi:hypothetical protein